MTETRILWDVDFLDLEGGHITATERVTQEAIPWCLTHKQALGHAYFGPKDGVCNISFGNPDHKWWVDV